MSDCDDTSCTSEVYEADSTTQANHIARDPELFESWATLVSLDTSIRTSTEDFPETLRDLLQASRVIPPWIINPKAPEYEHARPEHDSFIKALTNLVKDRERYPTGDDQELARQVRSSIVHVLVVSLHNTLLVRDRILKPTEADRRRAMDILTSHAWEYQGGGNFRHRVECFVQLPANTTEADQARTDSSVFINLDLDEMFSAIHLDIQKACSSARCPNDGWSLALHWVTEYERNQTSSTSERQAFQGMVSGLYQRRALGFMDHFVFGTAHHSGVILDVFAATWASSNNNSEQPESSSNQPKIVVYKLCSYQMTIPNEMLELYLLMRAARSLALTYKTQIEDSPIERIRALRSTSPNYYIWPPVPRSRSKKSSSGGNNRGGVGPIKETAKETWERGADSQSESGGESSPAVSRMVGADDVSLRSSFVEMLTQPSSEAKVNAYLATSVHDNYYQIPEQKDELP